MFSIINIIRSNMNKNKVLNSVFVKNVFTHFFVSYSQIFQVIHPWPIHTQQIY